MSGVVRGIGKVIRTVARVVKKVALPVVAASALVLSAGSAFPALGLPGWSALAGGAAAGAGGGAATGSIAGLSQSMGFAPGVFGGATSAASSGGLLKAFAGGVGATTAFIKDNPLAASIGLRGLSGMANQRAQMDMLERRFELEQQFQGGSAWGMSREGDAVPLWSKRNVANSEGSGIIPGRNQPEEREMEVGEQQPLLASGVRAPGVAAPRPVTPDPLVGRGQVRPRGIGEEEEDDIVQGMINPGVRATQPYTAGYRGPYGQYTLPLLSFSREEVPV